MVKLSVIIVNYNVAFFLEQCLISVQASCGHINAEIIVVDNNSNDESCSMIHQKFPSVKVIENKENVGFSKANNQGVAVAEGKYVLILNPDTVLAEDTLEKVILFAEKQKKVGAVAVKFIDGTGNFLPECKRNIPTIEIASRKLMGDSKRYYANQINKNDVSEVEILTGAFMLIKREVYLKVGGFDEDYFMFGEDIDLSYKLLNDGFQNYYFGKSTIIHYKGESTIKDKTYLKNFYGAMGIFYRKHFQKNILYEIMLKKALKALVQIKSTKIHVDSFVEKPNKIYFISENGEKYKKLEGIFGSGNILIKRGLPDNISNGDQVIFDNALITFKVIINHFQQLQKSKISMRINPKNTLFFIGSDSSESRGEVFKF